MADKPVNSDMISKGWHSTPDEPVQLSPVFTWPLDPLAIVRWIHASWLSVTARSVILLISIASWYLTQPALARCKTFQLDWIAQIWIRNMVLMVAVAGGLHIFLYSYFRQKDITKFSPARRAKESSAFTFNRQVYDNMFWTLASGVTVWTGIEVVTYWGYANGFVPAISFSQHPVWFVLVFFLLPIWGSFHFYVIHRFLHWKPLYQLAHSLHHRNVDIGPWSGMSMHPIEHVLYLSTGLIHWIVATHPIHFMYHMQLKALEAATSHSGYERLTLGGQRSMLLGDFFHQMHHRYFECNYGTLEMPWDRWFGSFHDGTEQAHSRMTQRRNAL